MILYHRYLLIGSLSKKFLINVELDFVMADVTKRVEKLEEGQVKHGEMLHEHDISIKLQDKDLQSAINGMSNLNDGLRDLNKTVIEQVVPMMNTMATAKKTKDKLEAKVGKIILGIIALVAVAFSGLGLFKQ